MSFGLVNMEGRRRRHQTWLRGRSSAAAFEDGPRRSGAHSDRQSAMVAGPMAGRYPYHHRRRVGASLLCVDRSRRSDTGWALAVDWLDVAGNWLSRSTRPQRAKHGLSVPLQQNQGQCHFRIARAMVQCHRAWHS